MISDFKIPNNAFHASEFWWILDLTVILRSLQKKFHFSFICRFDCCLVKEG